MSSVDLNIIERGLKGQAWSAEQGPITAGDLDKIVEQRTDNSTALNALPTPFARFFVVNEAFRRVLEEAKKPEKSAGDACHRLVSDTLDVFEILYNLKEYQKTLGDSGRIVVYDWCFDTDNNRLKEVVPILGTAVETYFATDLGALGKRLFFVVLEYEGHDYLLATSSPFTGFVTPPDLDRTSDSRDGKSDSYLGERYREMLHLKRLKQDSSYSNNGSCFGEIRLFKDRDKGFKNYMFYLVDNFAQGDNFKYLRDYIKHIQISDSDIIKNWEPRIEPIVSEGRSGAYADSDDVVINGMPIHMNSGLGANDLLNNVLVRVPFRLSKEYYRTMTYTDGNNDRDYDFLLPLSRKALSLIQGDFECICAVKKNSRAVTVTLKFNGQEYTKQYKEDPESPYHIVDLHKQNVSFNVAVFPNILSPNKDENNYFKVMAVLNNSAKDLRPVSIKNMELSFFLRNADGSFEEMETVEKDNTRAKSKYGVRPAVVRSEQQDGEIGAGSKFYEIYNTQFDATSIHLVLNGIDCEGVLIPNWRCAQRTQDAYTYAVDLGTTNTYISSHKVGNDNEPEQLNMGEPMVAFLHEFKRSSQYSIVKYIEDAIVPECRKNFNTEFAPALIDGDIYRFPIRTALCVKKDDRSRPSLFDNCNIAFFYEKSTGLCNQTILTDIKWEAGNGRELRVFIRELLLIIKADILHKNGLLANTKLIWFRPLSFKGEIKELYTTIWTEEAKNLLNIGPSQIECVSESEAPYYYFSKKNSFNCVDAVSIVDIGGGSSDFIYFAGGKPQVANSVHFGCDVLWGNGFNGFDNADENGIYKRYANNIHFEADELEQLNKTMTPQNKVSTKDIINFWLSNAEHCDITKELRANYKPLFLYHFASIVYFMAKMYKVKNLACPRAVLFCGNGSRYIDGLLSTDRTTIKELVTTIFKAVYGDIKDVQVILPDSRKECTCYGGLYRKSDVVVPAEFNFQGVTDKVYESVGDLKSDYQSVKEGLLDVYDSFNKLYIRLLELLIAKDGLSNPVKKDEIISRISSLVEMEDSLNTNFKTQIIDKYEHNDSAVYHDSVFFLPIIDNVLKLTKI